MSFVNPYADDAEAFSEHNYIVRHWRGYLPLPLSYWVNGGILFVATGMMGEVLIMGMEGVASLQGVAAGIIALNLLLLAMRVWALVGIWRSAGRHCARGGSAFWSVTARIMVVLGACVAVAQLVGSSVALREIGTLAAGGDSIGAPASFALARDGRDLVVNGFLTSGSAGRFETAAAKAPRLERVLLSSGGGRVFEAERMAKLIKSRRLATHVAEECHSACTLLLLAGRQRTAAGAARIGFHRASFPGISAREDEASNRSLSLAYSAAGVPRQFVSRVMATGPEEMWIPLYSELLKAKVLTDADIQAGAILAETAREMTRKLPMRVDEVTKLTAVTAAEETITYRYAVDVAAAPGFDKWALSQQIGASVHGSLCSEPPTREAIALGATFIFRYFDRKGVEVAEAVISRC